MGFVDAQRRTGIAGKLSSDQTAFLLQSTNGHVDFTTADFKGCEFDAAARNAKCPAVSAGREITAQQNYRAQHDQEQRPQSRDIEIPQQEEIVEEQEYSNDCERQRKYPGAA